MFLVDKYYNDTNYIICHASILRQLINSFDTQQQTYQNVLKLLNCKKKCISSKKIYQKLKLYQIINHNSEIVHTNQYNNYTRYSNFQHLIVYGPDGCSKDYLINKLLGKIFGENSVELKDVEYTVCGYSNTKTKIMIKQSKHHIIIEPNSNGFDKYLIQEIIQDYAKSELLNILKNHKLFKVVIINKIDNLSYYAQASLRRTMEVYSNSCKFILISDQLSKIIEPLRSRCLLVRVPLPSREQILNTLFYICNKENITIDFNNLYTIIENSDNKMSHAILLLELYNNNIKYGNDWEIVIESIINNIINANMGNSKKLYKIIKLIREQFYILFITNISTQLILRKIMLKLISKTNNLQLKYNIINITSIFEQRLSQGTRHNIHSEAYIIRLIYLFTNYHKNNMNNISDYNDVLEI